MLSIPHIPSPASALGDCSSGLLRHQSGSTVTKKRSCWEPRSNRVEQCNISSKNLSDAILRYLTGGTSNIKHFEGPPGAYPTLSYAIRRHDFCCTVIPAMAILRYLTDTRVLVSQVMFCKILGTIKRHQGLICNRNTSQSYGYCGFGLICDDHIVLNRHGTPEIIFPCLTTETETWFNSWLQVDGVSPRVAPF